MEIAKLVLDFVKVLIWPALVCVIVILFKDQIVELAGRLTSLSAPGVDAQFSDKVEKESSEALEAARSGGEAPEEPGRPAARHEVDVVRRRVTVDPLVSLAYSDPVAGMLAAWRPVELELYDIGSADPRDRSVPLRRVIDSIPDLPIDIRESLHKLRNLRNEAAHAGRDRTPSPEAAVEYVEGCHAMLEWLTSYRRGRES
ncbi:hypothetical protein [Streptomyces antibioticus]|uniref:hypothetical protein n=1 Tax=Streptomyces antibioticus TaxID=1890 RepID=UPI0036C24706